MAKRIVLASGKGGVGKSSVTVGLCRAFSSLGYRVLVVDADIGLRSLDMIFGVNNEVVFDWGDLIENRCKHKQATLDIGSAHLLPAPLKFLPSFKDDKLRRMVQSFEKDYDVILIDAPAGIGSGFRAAAAMAEEAILVSLPDSVCVRSCEIAAQELEKLGIEKQRLVINKFDKKAVEKNKLLNLDSVIDGCCVRLVGVVPEDKEILFRYTTGKELKKRSKTKKAFLRIAKRLLGENEKLVID